MVITSSRSEGLFSEVRDGSLENACIVSVSTDNIFTRRKLAVMFIHVSSLAVL